MDSIELAGEHLVNRTAEMVANVLNITLDSAVTITQNVFESFNGFHGELTDLNWFVSKVLSKTGYNAK